MNVAELINKLEKVPSHALVCVEGEQIFDELDFVYLTRATVASGPDWRSVYEVYPPDTGNADVVLFSPYGQDMKQAREL